MVAMTLLRTTSTACHSPSACMIGRWSAYAYFLETMVGKSEMQMLKRKGFRTDPCVDWRPHSTKRINLLRLPLSVVSVKVRHQVYPSGVENFQKVGRLLDDEPGGLEVPALCAPFDTGCEAMKFAETGYRREECPEWPVSLLMVLHALRLECEKSMELTGFSHRFLVVCSSREGRDKRLCHSQSSLGLEGLEEEFMKGLALSQHGA